MAFDEVKFIERVLDSGDVLTPVPERLTVHCSEGSSYYFDEVFDGSSLVWISLMQKTFNELVPGYDWTVDDPGTLYFDDESMKGSLIEDVDELEDSAVDMRLMQDVANVTLERYARMFALLSNVVPVVPEG